jgi:hypothetical protein
LRTDERICSKAPATAHPSTPASASHATSALVVAVKGIHTATTTAAAAASDLSQESRVLPLHLLRHSLHLLGQLSLHRVGLRLGLGLEHCVWVHLHVGVGVQGMVLQG